MVAKQGDIFPDKELREFVDKELEKRNINQETIGAGVYELQHKYFPEKTVEQFGAELPNVLKKREVLEPLAIGFTLDNLANEHKLPSVVQEMIQKDLAQFSTDELLAISICSLYGNIAVSAFGNADQNKIGLAKQLDTTPDNINTFADDLVSALVACCAGRFGQGSVK